ncbi:MAG: TonB C-terminal domain-containing protein [Verrucomicrobiia bacterium]
MAEFISARENINFKSVLGWVTALHCLLISFIFLGGKFRQPQKIALLQLLPQGALVKGNAGVASPVPSPVKAPVPKPEKPLTAPAPKPVSKPMAKPSTPTPSKPNSAFSVNLKEVKRLPVSSPIASSKAVSAPAQVSPVENSAMNANDIKNRLQGRVGKAGVASASADGQSGTWNGVKETSEVNAYFVLIRDVYYQSWSQPSLGVNNKLTAILKIRLGKSGNILKTTLEQSSGNVLFDHSIQEVAREVKSVGAPLPEVLGTQFADISIVFEF